MTQTVQFALAFVACTCLALAMNRHYRDVMGLRLKHARKGLLRTAGGVLLAASYIVAGVSRGWGVGAVEWFCIFGLSAGCVVLLLNYRPVALPAASAAALFVAVLILAFTL